MSETLPERESMEFDVVIVGAGPAGLAAAIRLKQLDPDLGVDRVAERRHRHLRRALPGGDHSRRSIQEVVQLVSNV